MAKEFVPVLFISHQEYLTIPLPIVNGVEMVEGRKVIKPFSPGEVIFRNSKYYAKDQSTVDFLRKHRFNGQMFYELPAGEKEKPKSPKGVKLEQAVEVKSKNEAMAFLLTKGCSVADMKKKTAADIVKMAHDTYSVVFPNWGFKPAEEEKAPEGDKEEAGE